MKFCAPALLGLAAAASASAASRCPCSSRDLCNPITTGDRQETLVFSVSNDNYENYDWSQVTTVAVFDELDMDLVCFAHGQGARVVMQADFPVANLSSRADRDAWVDSQVALVQDSFLDGVNIDFESPVNATQADWLTEWVNATTVAMHAAVPGSQVSVDVAWNPNDVDGRQFDSVALAEASDFLFVMSYDTRSQITGACVASANSPLPAVVQGYQDYLDLGINASKLVVGLPWYGYDYPCLELYRNGTCTIEAVPFRGANCSDAAGTEKDYSVVRKLETNHTEMWDDELQAPYFSYTDNKTGIDHQVWFDDPKSIGARLTALSGMGLRGVGMWTVDSLDYSGVHFLPQDTVEMWNALKEFSP